MPPPVGTLANPTTGAIDPYSIAFRAVVKYLQSHPRLDSVRTWKTWDGTNSDEVPPTAAQCPWIRLTPMIAPASYAAFDGMVRMVNTPLKIGIETAIVDTNFNASAMVWANLEEALFPSDDAGIAKLKAILRTARVSDLTLVQPALPTGLASYGDGLIVGDGAVQLDIARNL